MRQKLPMTELLRNKRNYEMTISGLKKFAAAVAVIFSAAIFSNAQNIDFAQVKATNLAGQTVQPLQKTQAKAVVFLFIQTDCPISNRYAPEIKRLYEKFASDGVTFWLVYPDKDDSAQAIRLHLKEFGYKMDALRDSRRELVKATGVNVKPEAAVFIPLEDGMRMVYRGRIDDLVAAFGKTRPAPTTHDLEETLENILGGKPVTTKTTMAIGCSISDLN
jgi:peroxiredoxin